MSRTYIKLTNKPQGHSKVNFQQYLYNANEPQEYISNGLSTEFEVELLENTELMRQDFRRLAQRMRNKHA